jgi:regulatory protein
VGARLWGVSPGGSRGVRARSARAAVFCLGHMKVTALKQQARNSSRVNVYLDGEFALGLTKILAARLAIGQQVDDAALERLKQADAVEVAYERALHFLETRPRSEAEIRRRLVTAKVPEEAVAPVLVRLREAGLVDDQAFASYWVDNRTNFRPRSKRLLQMELRQKGLGDEELKAALAGVNDVAAAYTVAKQRAGRFRQLDHLQFKRKLGAFLARRGFDYDTVGPTVERVWNELHEGSETET